MSSSSRNPDSWLDYLKKRDASYAEREEIWIRDHGINPYDPPSQPSTAPEIIRIDDPYWHDTRREVADGYDDAQDKSSGILVTVYNASWRISQEPTSGFPSHLAIQYLNILETGLSRDGPDIDFDWAHKRSREVAFMAQHAYLRGAFHSSAALAALARCLKDYALALVLRK